MRKVRSGAGPQAQHPKAGRTKALGMPVKFSDTPCSVTRAAPLLGQHTREILAELGYDEAAMDRLAAAGAVQCDDSLRG